MKRCVFLVFGLACGLSAQRYFSPGPAATDVQIAAIESRLKSSPGDAALRDQLAGAYLQKMRETADGSYLQRAEFLIKEVLKSDPSSLPARKRQIEFEMQRHHFRRVVELVRSLLRDSPDQPALLALYGDALMEMGEYDKASDVYQDLVDRKPGLPAYNRVAWFRFVTGDADGALQIARQALRLEAATSENKAWCLADLGIMLLKTGAVDSATESFLSALQAFPKYHHALAGLARVRAAQGREEEAITLLLQAQARVPYPEYSGMLALLYRKTGQRALAEKQIAMLDASDQLERAAGELANRNLALAFADLGYRTSRAVELARAELDIRQDVYTWDTLAWALFRDGKLQEAADLAPKAVSLNTAEPAFYIHAAQIMDGSGRTELARQYRERAFALNPKYDIASLARHSRSNKF